VDPLSAPVVSFGFLPFRGSSVLVNLQHDPRKNTKQHSLIPIAAQRVGVDPAVLSAPLITTLVDATGLIIYFSIAKLVLRV
jgi:magnesium transporter